MTCHQAFTRELIIHSLDKSQMTSVSRTIGQNLYFIYELSIVYNSAINCMPKFNKLLEKSPSETYLREKRSSICSRSVKKRCEKYDHKKYYQKRRIWKVFHLLTISLINFHVKYDLESTIWKVRSEKHDLKSTIWKVKSWKVRSCQT